MTDPKAAHVFTREGGAVLECTHCGRIEKLAFPMPVGMWLAVTNWFIEEHRLCEETKREEVTA